MYLTGSLSDVNVEVDIDILLRWLLAAIVNHDTLGATSEREGWLGTLASARVPRGDTKRMGPRTDASVTKFKRLSLGHTFHKSGKE